MSLTLTLPPDLQSALRRAAGHNGVDEETLALQILTQHLNFATASNEETLVARIQKLSEPRPQTTSERQAQLLQRSREGSLTDAEQQELFSLTDEAEERTAIRLELLLELSQRRGTSLIETISQLPLGASPHS